jgi:signal peptidase I
MSPAIKRTTTDRQARGGATCLALVLAGGVGLSLCIRLCLFHYAIIDGPSMTPTLSDGASCFVHRTLSRDIPRGEVVVVDDGSARSIKRVVGIPNESILFKDGKVYVNGKELHEDYLGTSSRTYPVFKTRFTLGREDYFVMGDNRGQSEDSRVYGPLDKDAIVGKVALR